VRVLARPNSDRRNLAGLAVEIAEGAMEDPRSLARAVAGCRYVYHVAADYRIWVPDPAPMFRANVEGTRDLLTAALEAGAERVVYTSSVATLGLVAGGSADEATPSSIDERYILGGENMALAEILAGVAQAVGRRPPRLRVPHSVLFPVAVGAELAARVTGRAPFVTLDGVRMSRKKMYFSSERASRELG